MTPATDTVTMMMAGIWPRSASTDWMREWRAPAGGEPGGGGVLTQQLLPRAPLHVAVEQAEVADEEEAADGGDGGEEGAGGPGLGPRGAGGGHQRLRLTAL